MAVLVNPHSEQEEKVLLAFLSSLNYEYHSAEHYEKPQTIIEYKKELDDALSRVKAGQFTTQDELEKEMQSW